jgi:hypothetical protein
MMRSISILQIDIDNKTGSLFELINYWVLQPFVYNNDHRFVCLANPLSSQRLAAGDQNFVLIENMV